MSNHSPANQTRSNWIERHPVIRRARTGESTVDKSRDGERKLGALWREVDWSLSYVSFLIFIFVILTYRFPIGDIAMAAALGGLLFEKNKVRFPRPLIVFGIFILWSAVGYFATSYPETVWHHLKDFGRLWLIFFVALNVLNSWPRVRFFLLFFLLIFATHPVRGALFNGFLYGYTEAGRFLWRGSFGNPNDLAALTFLPLGIAVALLRDPNRWIRWGGFSSVIVLPILILLTQSRGAMIALAFFGTVYLVRRRGWLKSAGIAVVLAAGIVAADPSGAWNRMEDLTAAVMTGDLRKADDSGSAMARFTIWQVGAEIIDKNPVTGVGLGAYPEAHMTETSSSREWILVRGEKDVHNTYIGVLAETGWPGFLLWISLIGVVIWKTVRTRRSLPRRYRGQLLGLEIALYAYLLAGLFGTFFYLTFLYLHLAVLLVAAALLKNMARNKMTRDQQPTVAPGYVNYTARKNRSEVLKK